MTVNPDRTIKGRVKYGVRGDSAYVWVPDHGDYRIEAPGGAREVSADDLTITERPPGDPLHDDEFVKWCAMDAFCDAFGAF